MPVLAYVANSNKVSVIDTSTNTIINTITVEPANNITKLITITPDGRFAYVTNLYDFVSVIDTCTNSIVDTITVGDFPVGVAVTPDGKYVYVANSGLATAPSGTISVINTATNTVINTIIVGGGPLGIAITPDGKFAYVTISKIDIVSVIDIASNTVVKNIPVGDLPEGIAITPDGNFAYVANQGQSALTNTVSVIDISTNTVVDTITVGVGPTWLTVTPDGKFVYVTNSFDSNVSVIDTATNEVIQTIPVGSIPFVSAATPDGNFIYVTNFLSNNVSVIDTTGNTVVYTIPNIKQPLGIAIANMPPCPAPSERMCIEVTRIFDSCMFEEQQRKTFETQYLIEDQEIECEMIGTECKVLDVSKIDNQKDFAKVKLQIKVFLRFISNCLDNPFKKVLNFDKNITLIVPDGAEVCCDINNVTCICNKTGDLSWNSKTCDKVCCTVKVTAVVKSKKLVQIEVPLLSSCEPNQCSPYEGISIAPGKSFPLPNNPSKICRITFSAKTKPGMTSSFLASLNAIPYNFKNVTENLKPFVINLPGSYLTENIQLRNIGKSTIYVYDLKTE